MAVTLSSDTEEVVRHSALSAANVRKIAHPPPPGILSPASLLWQVREIFLDAQASPH